MLKLFPGEQLKRRIVELCLVLTGLVLVTGVIWWTDADRALALIVRGPHKINPLGHDFWPTGSSWGWVFLYKLAPWPAVFMGLGALVVLLAGFFRNRLAGYRTKSLYILLFLALGPGLVVNTLLKDNLGRARPREVIEYGGSQQFTQVWQPGTAGKNSSFPSGHAAIAFALMAPWFVLRDSRKKTALFFLLFGFSFGSLISLTRILQGAHFLSDVVWSAGLLYLSGGLLALFFSFDGKSHHSATHADGCSMSCSSNGCRSVKT